MFTGPRWAALLARRSEQPMFFVPFVLMAVLLALKVDPGMITLAWGAEAVVVFVLALWAKERSFRVAALVLLLLCAAKIILWDVWQLNDPTARYLTLIGRRLADPDCLLFDFQEPRGVAGILYETPDHPGR